MSLRAIVHALGGDLYDGGRRANIPGPGHSRRDRSVSLLLSGDRVIVHAFGRSSWQDAMACLKDEGFVDGDGRLLSGGSGGPVAELSRLERVAAARRLWEEASPIGRNLSARHLGLRKIAHAPPVSPALRHHPAVAVAVYARRGPQLPALLAAVSDPAGALTAVELTYLDANGERTRCVRVSRKIVGVVPASSAVRLYAPGPELLVGEGVFTTLSAATRFALPAWALLSTVNLRRWSPPDQVRRVLIAADPGPDGQASALTLSTRLARLGRRTRIETPPEPWSDWNDADSA